MMLGERSHGGTTLHVAPGSFTADNHNSFSLSPNDITAYAFLDDYSDSLTAPLQRSHENEAAPESQFLDSNINGDGDILSVDARSCDQFRMFEFKVRMCSRGRPHDWTQCPFAHPGERARRRDPTKFHYSGTACPDFRKGTCPRADACEFAHGVFEFWLHPARYRTQPCKDGVNCKRRVCFFAHSPDQLRILSPRADSPHRVAFVSSPEWESPPISPMPANSVSEMVASLRQLKLNKVISMPSSPRVRMTRLGCSSLPTTPTRPVNRIGIGYFDGWGDAHCEEEEPVNVMERVESGRDLRFRMFEKLCKEYPLDRVNQEPDPNPDVGWVSELVK